jgi:hypothetical protein
MGKNPMVINNLKSYKNLLLTPWTLTIIQKYYHVITWHHIIPIAPNHTLNGYHGTY